ncbi:MAG: serine/threonine-protein kinase [Proteobacteria bacterium]|nr:serine/threonine-protein kinase [Pseudomonadota bacterium]
MEQEKTQVWQQAIEIYADVSELSPNKALAHVDSLHNLSDEIKLAVITLINSGSQASRYIQDHYTPDFDSQKYQQPEIKPGTQLGEYELIEKLGQGGMSQVFKAKRLDSEAQKMVAIKIFSPKYHSQLLLDRFIKEQQILSGFSHPNIVDMLHGGTTDNNTAYLVMELIDNALTLDKYSAKEHLSVKQNIAIIEQCAKALAYSHANLIIHRDLKPDNILINSNNQVKIVDFGIAKLINNDIDGSNTTIMALTPNYAAPEQINSQAITVKTDIFSLAVVALDILCKAPPLPKDRLIKSCINDDEFIDKNLKKTNVDKDLKNILRKALEQNPDNRYSSMQSFADDLNCWLADKPVKATAPSVAYRVKKFAQRRTALFTTLISFFVFLLMGSILGYQQYKQIKIEASKAQNVKQFLLDSFNVTDPNFSEGVDISAQDILQVASTKLSDNELLDPEIKFELYQTIGLAYGQLGFATKAIDFLKKSLDINKNNSKSLSYLVFYLKNSENEKELENILLQIDEKKFTSISDMSRVIRVRVKVLVGEGKLKLAKEKVEVLNKQVKKPLDKIQNNRLMAEIYFQMSDVDKAIELLNNTINLSALKSTNTFTLGLKKDLIQYYTKKGAYDSALDASKKLISQQRTILGNRHPDLGDSLIQLSETYQAKGDMVNAIIVAQESHDIFIELYGDNNVRVARPLTTLGIIAYSNHKIDEAERLLTESLKIIESSYSPIHLETMKAKTNLAGFFNAVGKTEKAVPLLQDVYKIQLQSLGAQNGRTIFTQQHLARALASQGKLDEAIKIARLAVQSASQAFDASNPIAYGSDYTLGKTYQQAGKNEAALKVFLAQEKNGFLKQNNPKFAILLHDIAKSFAASGQIEQAKVYYQKSILSNAAIYTDNHTVVLRSQLLYAGYLQSINQTNESKTIIEEVEQLIKTENIENKGLQNQISRLLEEQP